MFVAGDAASVEDGVDVEEDLILKRRSMWRQLMDDHHFTYELSTFRSIFLSKMGLALCAAALRRHAVERLSKEYILTQP